MPERHRQHHVHQDHDSWGDGNPATRETGCVDALFAAQTERRMLSTWLGRNGFDGSGGAWPIRVGLNDQNAYYDGTQVQIGKNTAGQWISSLDVVAPRTGPRHRRPHPGWHLRRQHPGVRRRHLRRGHRGLRGQADPNDTPDYKVGEEVNLVGSGPIRYMYNPSLAGDDNCYSSSIPSEEVHAAAGPGNHWFYLLAEGSSPTNGQPASSTCNGSPSPALGIQKAIKIMYNAMLMKTSAART